MIMAEEYLKRNKWEKNRCLKCDSIYWKKKDENINCCQRINCLEGKVPIFDLKKKQEYKDLNTMRLDFLNYFSNYNSMILTPHGMLDSQDTLFTIAGIQKFDEVIHNNVVIPSGNYIFVQPCIRIKALDLVKKNIGYLSSFNMLCMEEFLTSPVTHEENIDRWINYLNDSAKIPIQKISLVEKNWTGGKMFGSALVFLLGGLELGEIIHVNVPQEYRNQLVLTDAGFSLERLAWVLARGDSPYNVIGPLEHALRGDYIRMDVSRTLTLMSMQGLKPGNNKREYLMRKLVNDNLSHLTDFDFNQLIDHYYDSWSKVLAPLADKEEVKSTLSNEINRAKNRRLLNKLNRIPSKRDLEKPHEETLKNLLLKEGLNGLRDNFK